MEPYISEFTVRKFSRNLKKKTVLEQKEMDSKHFVLFLYGYLYAGNVEY